MPREDQQERRLRPIYDALDARNWKTGLKLVTAAAAKHGDSLIFKALKAVALQRLGKNEEALQLSKEIIEAGTADEHVLSTLSLAVRPLGRMSDITLAYEKAVEKQGGSTMLKGLFSCYLRESDYPKQQFTALRLTKVCNDSSYLWWAVASYALQARATAVSSSASGNASLTASGMSFSKLLQLAESMIGRCIAKQDGKMKYEELMMYVDILLAQGKISEARQIVAEKSKSIAMLSPERKALEAALHIANDDMEAAVAVEEQALSENPNDWASYLLYMDCLLPGTSSLQHGSACSVPHVAGGLGALPELVCQRTAAALLPDPEEVDIRVEKIQKMINLLIEKTTPPEKSTSETPSSTADGAAVANGASKVEAGVEDAESASQTDGPVVREGGAGNDSVATSESGAPTATSNGPPPFVPPVPTKAPMAPHLAGVELQRRLVLQGLKDHQELAEAILDYFKRAGDRTSCSNQLQTYTKLVEGSSRQWLIGELVKYQTALKEHYPSPPPAHVLNIHVNAIQVQHDLGFLENCSLDAALSHSVNVMELYSSSQSIWKGLDPREAGPADHLITLSASALLTSHSLEPHSLVNMLRALMVLHAGVLDRPFHAGMQLSLTALYGLLGCPNSAVKHFNAMDIKHIQLDSLASHHLLPILISYHSYDEALKLLQASQKLFDDHLKDAESLFAVFKHGSWSKVLEFAAFTERLESAHSRALVQVEHAAMTLLRAGVDGVEAVQAALPKVCESLPNDILETSRWGRLRFNQDLSTRPSWLPPALAQDCHLAVAHWWSEVQPGSFKGYARCWWASPFSVEGTSVQAKNTRASARLVVARRGLLPLVFRHILQSIDGAAPADEGPTGTASTPSGDASKLFEVYSRLSMGFDADAQRVDSHMRDLVEMLKCQGCQGSGSGSSCLLLMQTCSAFKLAVTALNLAGKDLVESTTQAAQRSSASDPTPSTAPPSSSAPADTPSAASTPPNASEPFDAATCFCTRVAILSKVMRRFCEQLSTSIGNAERMGLGGLIPGSLISLAALYAHQQSCMLMLACQAWSRHLLPSGAKKKKGKKTGAEPTSQLSPAVVEVLIELQKQLVEGCDVIAKALAAVTSRPIEPDLDALLTRLSPSGPSRSAKLLWGWQSRLDVKEVLFNLLKEQRETIAGIHTVLQARMKMVSTIKFGTPV